MTAADLPVPPPEMLQKIPRPQLGARAELVRAYDAAWALAARDALREVPQGPLIASTFSPMITAWDVLFTPFWLRYAPDAFGPTPPLAGLDLFYGKAENGRIPLWLGDTDSSGWQHPAQLLPAPPLAWAEWEYASVTGDDSRLKRVLPVLAADFDWQLQNRTRPQGYFFHDAKLPFHNRDTYGFADATMMAAFNSECLALIAHYCEEKDIADAASANYLGLKELMNEKCWDDLKACYLDMDEDEIPLGTLHAGAFWGLLAEMAPEERRDALLRHLDNYRQFGRPHPIPTLAASEHGFHRHGARWQGEVWSPLTYVAIAGAARAKARRLSSELALRHVEAVGQALLRHGRFHDSYAPDFPGEPAEGAREGFAGWSPLAPISLLLEQVIGVEVSAWSESLTWRPFLEEDHGVENLRVGNARVNLYARWRQNGWDISVNTTGPAFVQIVGFQGSVHHDFDEPGSREFRVS